MPSKTPKCLIVAADFAKEIVEVMVEEATKELPFVGAELGRLVLVSGSYEIPLVADHFMRRREIDFVVVLGYIERGETLHGEVMGHAVHKWFVDLQMKHGKPLGIGIIGPGATMEQAQLRKADYARDAVRAAVRTWKILQEVN